MCAAALRLTYDRPATDWESESLPIGNGFEGASVFGGIDRETLVLSEKTLWTGGPGGSESYRHGTWSTSPLPVLGALRDELTRTPVLEPADVAARLGEPKAGYGASQVFARVDLVTGHDPRRVTDYRRGLDLRSALADVSYRLDDTGFRREVFASNPARVIAARFTTDRKAGMHLRLAVSTADNRTKRLSVDDTGITLTGALHDNGMRYKLALRVQTIGGTTTPHADALTVTAAEEIVLVLAFGTDYALTFPTFRGELDDTDSRVHAALAAGYDQLRQQHLGDYRSLFDRFDLELEAADRADRPAARTTDWALAHYQPGDIELETLAVQYGRYLLISSSRPGALPAHLQGLWNSSTNPPWSCDYHVNINLQMNYWPARATGLAETEQPYHDFTHFLATTTGPLVARQLGAAGWAVLLATTPFGYAGVIEYATSFWFVEAAAWMAHDVAEAVRSTGDEQLLTDIARPVIAGAAAFWLDFLVADPDGSLVVSPSYSPEHGGFTAGAAMSQQIVRAVLTDAVELLDPSDDLVGRARAALDRLDPGLRIGGWGQLQEWKLDLDDPLDHHRHVSQLFALYPGDALDATGVPDELRARLHAAVAVSLDARGDDGPGWCQAWRAALRARLGDAEAAHRAVGRLVGDNLLPNLWGNHPPFQIDANFGLTAAVVEMLVRSHERWCGRDGQATVRLLPALPSAWPSGHVRGIRTRCGDVVDLTWRDGQVAAVDVTADHPHRLTLSGAGLPATTADVAPTRPFTWSAVR